MKKQIQFDYLAVQSCNEPKVYFQIYAGSNSPNQKELAKLVKQEAPQAQIKSEGHILELRKIMLIDLFNLLGAAGWELISYTPVNDSYWLKKEH